jgi:hypothetical protein
VNGHPVLLDRQRLAAAPVEVDAAVAPYGGAVSGYQPCGSVALRAEVERVRLAVLPTQPFERRLYLRAALAKRVALGPTTGVQPLTAGPTQAIPESRSSCFEDAPGVRLRNEIR